jgi:alkaline phosphatase D
MDQNKFRYARVVFFILLASVGLRISAQETKSRTTVILSLDGFRWDYPLKTSTPSLDKIALEGVKAASLIPSFPSKTFPNHYTIATGLVPDHHGIVNNAFYDRQTGKSYAIGNMETRFDPVYYRGEPIWITAYRQGLRTASFYWVGSDVAIDGLHPDYWKSYDERVPFINRIDTIIKWLSLPEAIRPKLVMAYYHEPDGVGHDFGPDDARTFNLVHELDSLTGILYNRIRQLPDGENINFIVCSDHGMGAVSSERNIVLRDLIPESWPVRIEGGNPNFNLYAEGVWIDSAYTALKKAPGLKVWKPGEVPAYLNYGTNPREGDIIVVADSAWAVSLNRPDGDYTGGTHGYDIHNTDIHAIFYAAGPSFKKNYIHSSFQNIHIYPLLAHILGIIPAKSDGELQQVIEMLIPKP